MKQGNPSRGGLISPAERKGTMKTYVFTYKDNAGGGRRYIWAADEKEALKRLKRFLSQYHRTRKYTIELEQVLPE